jgi:hypothetical protein
MVQILPSKSFGTRFSQAFQPAVEKGIDRFLGEEKEKRKETRQEEAMTRQKLLGKQMEEQAIETERAKKEELLDRYLAEIPEDQLSQKERALIKATTLGGAQSGAITQLLKPPTPQKPEKAPPLTPFQKTQQSLAAKEYEKLKEEIPKLESQFENINYAKQLASELKGPGGFISAAVGGKKATELNTLGFAMIDPILKIFNPVGPIPVAKVNIIRSQFAPKAGELYRTTIGKLNSLERLAQQAYDRANQRLALYEAYDGSPPENEVRKFDKESTRMLDTLTKDQKTLNKKNEEEGEELVSGYVSVKTGKKLKALPKAQIEELLEKGLIQRGD